MMKILFLNPHLYEAPVLGTLRSLGVAAIVCSDLKECELVFKLHATSITLFVGHDADGVGMNEILKKTPRFARTPVILTTSTWTDQQCIEHQATPFGANAYLRMPVEDKEFIHVIDQILGTELSHGKGFNLSDDLSGVGPLEIADSGAPLEIAPASIELAPVEGAPIEIASSEDRTSVGIAPIDVATPIEASSIEPLGDETQLSIIGSSDMGEPGAAPTDGITLQTDLGAVGFSSSSGIQIEDAAAVYGNPSPGTENAEPSEFEFKFDSPLGDEHLGEEKASGETKEFRIDSTSVGEPAGASEVLATPIEGTSIDTLSPVDNLAPIGDDEATRVATPIFIESSKPSEEKTEVSRAPRVAAESENAAEEMDLDSLAAMPYLGKNGFPNPLAFREPMDDAVVPGGAATAPDTETLKKYLYLREQDVTALSAQLRQAREQIGLLEGQLKHERAVSSEFANLAQEQDRRINGFEKEKAVALEAAQKEFDDLKFEMKRRSEKIRVMELQVKEATDATERLKERVRNDIRKIRTREKELENRLEIMKKDSEALLGSREQKIIELKRKLDLLEFNTDLVQDLLEKERQVASGLREKLTKAAQMMRVAGGLLGPEEGTLLEADVDTQSEANGERTTAA
jgi:CheY-like chemotaxis protein